MAEQQEYGLQPEARPTDQYARPEVRMPAGYEQGKQLSQVSEALRGFSSDIGEIADRRYAAWRQATDRQADQYALTHAAVLQNQQDLKGAVYRGEIQQHASLQRGASPSVSTVLSANPDAEKGTFLIIAT